MSIDSVDFVSMCEPGGNCNSGLPDCVPEHPLARKAKNSLAESLISLFSSLPLLPFPPTVTLKRCPPLHYLLKARVHVYMFTFKGLLSTRKLP